jgi:hypothetical protein
MCRQTTKEGNDQIVNGARLKKRETSFSNETIESLRELGAVLSDIRKRLRVEGYTIKDGKIYNKEGVMEA